MILVLLLVLLPFSTSRAQEPTAGATFEERLATAEGRQRAEILVEAVGDESLGTARRLELAQEALETVGSPGDHLELRLHLGLASIYRDLGEARPMRQHSDRALVLADDLDDSSGRARAILYRGHAAYWLSEYSAALDAAREAFALFQALGDTRRCGEASWLEGATQGRIGAHAQAIEAYRRTLDLYDQVGFERGVARTRYSIAVRYFFLSRLEEATTLAQRALDGAMETENPTLEVMCIQLLGNIAREQGRPTAALDFLQRALTAQRRLDDTSWNLAEIQQNLGDTYIALGELDEAERYLADASSFYASVGNRFEVASTLLSRGRIHNLRGDHDAASPLLDQAHDLTAAIASRPKRSEILHELSATYAAAGRYREALDTFQRYEALRRELFDEQSERQINQMQTQLEVELKEERIDHLERQQTLGEMALARQRAQRVALLIGFASLLAILLLLFNRYRLKSRQALLTSAMRQEQRVSAQLREIDQLKDEFLANTSHQLRTPLYGMIGLVETVLDGAAEIPDDTRATLGNVLESGQRLTGLIDDLLDFSKLRRHSLDLNLESVELYALTDIVLTLSRTLADGRDVELVNTVARDLPPAQADPMRVQQVLQHLTHHCIRSSTGGRVEVSAEVVGDDLSIQIACRGGQIVSNERERLVAAFAGRYDEDISASIGLDLAMSRWLVEIHGGQVEIDTELEDGAAIRFNLPITGTETLTIDAPSAAPTPQAEPTTSNEDATTILLVDDEPVVRLVLYHHLADEGYRLISTSNGAEALDALDRESIDLVLLDVMMPRMSGYEVCRRIRETRSRDELPVLFLSAKSHTDDRVAGFDVGGNDYLVKPIARDELLARARAHLELSAMAKRQAAETQTLRGLLPICSSCKKIRDDGGYWKQVEVYISQHSGAQFSHGICPDCAAELYSRMER